MYSLLKSGIKYSPTSFFHAIPGRRVNDLIKEIFVLKQKAVNFNQIDFIDHVMENFLDNNWNNARITYIRYDSSWNESETFESNFLNKPRVLIKKYLKTNKQGIISKVKYLNFFYKQVGVRVETDLKTNEQKTFYQYKLIPAKGLTNELIETQPGLSIIPSNNESRPIEDLVISPAMENKILSGQKTIYSTRTDKKKRSGKYRLPNGTIVKLQEINKFTYNEIKKNFSLFGIKGKNALEKFAKAQGYNSIKEMTESKANTQFFKKGWGRVFYTITKISTENLTIFKDNSIVTSIQEQQASTMPLNELTKQQHKNKTIDDFNNCK